MRRATIVLALLLAAPLARADDEARGKAIWNEGVTLYNLGEFQGAIEKFEAAYRFFPNPNLLFSLGQAHRQKKEYEAAIFNFKAYLRLKPQASNRAVVEKLIAELDGLIAEQRKSGEKPPVNVEPPPVPAAASQPAPTPEPEERRWYQDTVGWGIVGAGVVAAGVGIGLLAHAGSQSSDAAAAMDQQTAVDLTSSARSTRMAGGVVLGVGLAVIAGGALKMALFDRGPGEPARVSLAAGPGLVALRGQF